jgi:osmotically-inducible protein OsmY
VVVEGGKVILAGVVNGSGNVASGIRIIEKIDGVTEVKNNVAFVPVNSGV